MSEILAALAKELETQGLASRHEKPHVLTVGVRFKRDDVWLKAAIANLHLDLTEAEILISSPFIPVTKVNLEDPGSIQAILDNCQLAQTELMSGKAYTQRYLNFYNSLQIPPLRW